MATSTQARNASILEFASGLPATSLPATVSPSEPSTISLAAKKGLKKVQSLNGGEVCEQLAVDPRQGLSLITAARRLDQYGQNTPPPLLEKAVGGSAWLKARHMKFVTVIRGNEVVSVSSNNLVVGDIVFLEAGDDVLADIRVLRTTVTTVNQTVFVPGTGLQNAEVEIGTTADATFISGHLPVVLTSGAANKELDKANNVVLFGMTILTGKLLGVIFATGSACYICSPSSTQLKRKPPGLQPQQRLPRNADKKKVAKVAQKLSALGMVVHNSESIVPICGCQNMNVILCLTSKHLESINDLLRKLIGQGYRIIVILPAEISPDAFTPLPSPAIGLELPSETTLVGNRTDAEKAAHASSKQSLIFVQGPDDVSDLIVEAFRAQFSDPTVIMSDSVLSRVAAPRSTLALCTYAAPPACLQVASGVIGPSKLAKLTLFLKIMQESSEIYN